MTIDTDKVIAGLVAIFTAFFGGGAGWRFAQPFAQRAFDHWLTAKDRKQAAEEKKAAAEEQREQRTLVALERHATFLERSVGALERIEERQASTDARLERLERHLSVPTSPSFVPPAPAPVDTRASITGEHKAPSPGQVEAALVPKKS